MTTASLQKSTAAMTGTSSCDLIRVSSGVAGFSTAVDGMYALQSTLQNYHPWYLATDAQRALVRTMNASEWRVLVYPFTNPSTVLAVLPGDGWVGTGNLVLTASASVIAVNSSSVPGVRVVKVIQMLNDNLDEAEIQIWSADSPPINLALSHAACFSGPTIGYWYNGNRSTGAQRYLNDGFLNTSRYEFLSFM